MIVVPFLVAASGNRHKTRARMMCSYDDGTKAAISQHELHLIDALFLACARALLSPVPTGSRDSGPLP